MHLLSIHVEYVGMLLAIDMKYKHYENNNDCYCCGAVFG